MKRTVLSILLTDSVIKLVLTFDCNHSLIFNWISWCSILKFNYLTVNLAALLPWSCQLLDCNHYFSISLWNTENVLNEWKHKFEMKYFFLIFLWIMIFELAGLNEKYCWYFGSFLSVMVNALDLFCLFFKYCFCCWIILAFICDWFLLFFNLLLLTHWFFFLLGLVCQLVHKPPRLFQSPFILLNFCVSMKN